MLVGGLSVPASAASPPMVKLTSMAFGTRAIDTTSGAGSVNLTWTVSDKADDSEQVTGTVTLSQFIGNTPVGPDLTVSFARHPDGAVLVFSTDGDPTNSTYVYSFPVGQYGPASKSTWRVVAVEASGAAGGHASVAGTKMSAFHADLNVTARADTTVPSLDFMGFSSLQTDVSYDQGSGAQISYLMYISDGETGFWKGSFTLTGPNGASATQAFAVTGVYGSRMCGTDPVSSDTTFVICDIEIDLPVGAPTGQWQVSSVTLTDAAGNSTTITDAGTQPVLVVRDDVITASDFAIAPAVVDNWRENKTTTFSFATSGLHDGVATAELGGSCLWAGGPSVDPDGTVSIELLMTEQMDRCEITGLKLTDGDGNVAVYGSDYAGAPDLGTVVVQRVPDTTPPVALAAALSTATYSAANPPNGINVDVTMNDTVGAPLNGYTVIIYDANHNPVGGGDGGIGSPGNGVAQLFTTVGSLQPGTYSVGFILDDAAGNSSSYGGFPVNNPVPGGPLILTVTP